jgi:hypothetical protein
MHRTRVQTGKPGFGHSRYLNARLSYSYTLVHIRHQSEPGMTEPGTLDLLIDLTIAKLINKIP